jgi:predicted NBD/HSP70 family sugar kinase
METPRQTQILSVLAASTFALTAMIAGYRSIGLPPVVIVGGSSVIALIMWIKTYLRKPLDPQIMPPPGSCSRSPRWKPIWRRST